MAIFEQGEKPTKYFFNMEKIYNRKKISELKLASEKPTTKESENLEEIETFYRTFYSSAGKVSNETFDSFVSNIQLPTLSSEERLSGRKINLAKMPRHAQYSLKWKVTRGRRLYCRVLLAIV